MTAIAAVIALSSTPLFAQSVDAPALTMPAPAIEVTPAPAAADPLAPEAAAKPAAHKATTVKSTAARPRPVAARAASAAPMLSAAGATISDPDAAAPVEPLAIQAEAASVPAPIAEPPVTADTTLDPMIPIAGFGTLGILALAGVGLAVRRRRRRAEEEAEGAARQQYIEALPDADAEPATIVEPKLAPVPGSISGLTEPAFVRAIAPETTAEPEPSAELEGPVTELPEDFDLSRFTPHQQAAYKGPTEDNPSLSLKNRLSRANGMDQLEEREADPTSPVEAPDAKPTMAHQAKADFMLRRPGMKPNQKPGVLPAHSH